ncbi:MAG TPA: tetratricopeptide repeat protein [Nitrososphaera sp.]|jgi:tetratricopeptide (TPR) repeat protein|nr:tetratricopeptide repeat protein [Nitrososphaera sp.]
MTEQNFPDPTMELSQAAERGKEIVAIVERLVSQVSENKNEVDSLLAAGKIREIEQRFILAKQIYLTINRLDPKALEALARLALVYLKMGNPIEGLAVAKRLVEQDKDFRFADISGRPVSAMTVLGDAYRQASDLEQAKTAYQSAIEIQPNDAHSAAKLAEILLGEHNVSKAAELVDRFIDGSELDSYKATIQLLQNDANRLPAIKGVIENRSLALFSNQV